MTIYRQETILAMELDRSHIGKLVQIITESWSMTGTLARVDQHDNREWSIDYANGRGLVPSGGEIYTVLQIGPWEGRVIGNQPVTVETVAGTLEAPERVALDTVHVGLPEDEVHVGDYESPAIEAPEPEGEWAKAIEGTVVEAGEVLEDVHAWSSGLTEDVTLCGLGRDGGQPRGSLPPRRQRKSYDRTVTCPACLERLY